jgi:hypothetical protein
MINLEESQITFKMNIIYYIWDETLILHGHIEKKGELIGQPFYFFRQIGYFPLEEQKPNLILELKGAILDSGEDVQKMLNDYQSGCKSWMTHQVHYETVNNMIERSLKNLINISVLMQKGY